MSVSNTRMSSEFSSVLSSTMSSASLLPGNSESSVKDLKKQQQPNKNCDQILDTHFNMTMQCGLSNGASYIPISSTSAEGIPSISVTLL